MDADAPISYARAYELTQVIVDEVCYWFTVACDPDREVTLARLQAERRDFPFDEARKTLLYLLQLYGVRPMHVAELLHRTRGTITVMRQRYEALLRYDYEAQWDVQTLSRRIDERVKRAGANEKRTRRGQDAEAGTRQYPRRSDPPRQGVSPDDRRSAGVGAELRHAPGA